MLGQKLNQDNMQLLPLACGGQTGSGRIGSRTFPEPVAGSVPELLVGMVHVDLPEPFRSSTISLASKL